MANVPGIPIVSQEEGEQHRKSAGMLAYRLTNRKRALIEQTLDKLLEGAGKGGDRDPVATLAAQYFKDPMAWLSWLGRMLPQEQAAPGAPIGNVASMFLQAVQTVNSQGHETKTINAVVIEPGTSRVHDDASDW